MFLIATPGSKYGPCPQCEHPTCDRQRQIAVSACYLCCQVVGYRVPFCCDLDGRPVHLECARQETQSTAHDARPMVFNKTEAAELLRISEATLNDLIYHNQISRTKIGARVVFTSDQLRSFLRRCEIRCSAEEQRIHRIK